MGLAAAALALAIPAAEAATTDLVVHCDRSLARPLAQLAAAFYAESGVRLRVFPTAPNAIAAQVARQIQNDVVVTQPGVLAQIAAAQLLADGPQPGPWRNRLVIAGRRGEARVPLAQSVLAAPDPGWGGGPDGPALLAAAGLQPARLIGTFDTEEARGLLLSGEAGYAVLHVTELTPEIEAIPTPGFGADLTYMAALTKSARRPNPQALIAFLAGERAAAAMRAGGLEKLS
jgi:molybdate transport system substrate-binding protein